MAIVYYYCPHCKANISPWPKELGSRKFRESIKNYPLSQCISIIQNMKVHCRKCGASLNQRFNVLENFLDIGYPARVIVRAKSPVANFLWHLTNVSAVLLLVALAILVFHTINKPIVGSENGIFLPPPDLVIWVLTIFLILILRSVIVRLIIFKFVIANLNKADFIRTRFRKENEETLTMPCIFLIASVVIGIALIFYPEKMRALLKIIGSLFQGDVR